MLRRLVVLLVALAFVVAAGAVLVAPRRSGAQGVDVYVNVTGGGARKLNIAIPEFTVVSGADSAGYAKSLASITGTDLTISGLFSVVAGTGSIPPNNPDALRKSWTDFAQAGAHAGLHGLLAIRPDRLEVEMRLYDLTSPDQRQIAAKKFDMPVAQSRRLAHKIADEVVLQFTGEAGIADTKLAFIRGPVGNKDLWMADYDGYNAVPVTRNASINLMPAWSPDARSIAFTSYMNGYPDLYRIFPFERRPVQTLAAFIGINSTAAWSPDRQNVAMTLSKDGNPEIYVLNVTTGSFRRLTRNAAIDTEPTWSPTGREIAFVSDRSGAPHIFVMDADGGNVRQLTFGGRHTQPRWSPKGDTILFTQRAGNHDVWAVSPDGSNVHRLTSGPGDNESPTWAPDGRHVAFQSSRLGGWQLFWMFSDGSEQTPITRGSGENTSPSWSPRLP